MPEDLLRKHRPVGPTPDLRARILADARPVWPWAGAAAALLATALGLHAAAERAIPRLEDDHADLFSAAVDDLAARLDGTAAARMLAQREILLVVMRSRTQAGAVRVADR